MISTGPLPVWFLWARHSIPPNAANIRTTAAANHSRPRPRAGSAASAATTEGSSATCGTSLSPRNDGPTTVDVPEAGLVSERGSLMSRKRGRSMRASTAPSGSNPNRLSTSASAAVVVSLIAIGSGVVVEVGVASAATVAEIEVPVATVEAPGTSVTPAAGVAPSVAVIEVAMASAATLETSDVGASLRGTSNSCTEASPRMVISIGSRGGS